jgi:DNA repair exonuclease SbcCD nuclease subunit
MSVKHSIKFANISDIHIGSIDPFKLQQELEVVFLTSVKNENYDVIFLSGDTFDKIISLNSDHAKLASWFINELITLMNGKPIYILKGTKTHDNDMLDNYSMLHDKNLFVINSVCEVSVFEGFNVLFIPEEYPVDMDEYYAKYFSKKKKYNLIIGHGQIDRYSFESQISESERNIPTAPVFKIKEIIKLADLIIFGHIHIAQNYKNFYYCGSYSRSAHGEAKEKGFLEVEYDLNTRDYDIYFIENDLAQKYITLKISEIEGETFEDKLKTFLEIIKADSHSKYRLDIDSQHELSDVEIQLLKKITKNESISLKHKQTRKETKEQDEVQEKYKFVNENIPIQGIIQKFIAENSGITLSIDEIEEVLDIAETNE